MSRLISTHPRGSVGVDLELRVLRLRDEMTEAEVAAHLGITVPAVRRIVVVANETTATYYGIDAERAAALVHRSDSGEASSAGPEFFSVERPK